MEITQNYLAKTEQLLNPIDWIPFISSFSGMVRILAGIVEIVAGAVFVYIKTLDALLTRSKVSFDESRVLILHGMANMIRGAIAMLPVFNLVLCFYDTKLLGRFNYPYEKMNPRFYPIASAKMLAH